MKRNFIKTTVFWFIFCVSIGCFAFVPKIKLAKAQTSQTGNLIYADSGVPIIQPRSVWDNTPELHALMTWFPQASSSPSDWQPVERVIIHDTATPNDDPLTPIQRMQSIYRFHAITKGWGDIGYNYLIDKNGVIYEGRYGGNGSRGAHAFNSKTNQNFNYGSVGISLFGEYSNSSVPSVMFDSLARLVGWLGAVNNFDPAQTAKTFSIWDAATKSFDLTFFGPVVVGHKDVDTAKPDPGTLDFVKLRTLAAQYKQQYQNLLYQVAGDPHFYQIVAGVRKTFNSLADFTTQGGSYQKIATISQSQLDLFSPNRFFRYPDGSLLRFIGSPMIYLIDGGKKRQLDVTANQFAKLGFDWAKVISVTSGDLSLYPDGLPIIFATDKGLISDSAGRVYLIENGKKRWITSENLFKTLGYVWKNVKKKTADQAAQILDGPFVSYPSGTLVKASGPTVYLVDNGQKREFLSWQSFNSLGYKMNKVLTIDDNELALYPTGPFVPYKDKTIVRQQNEPTVYQIFGGKKLAFISAEQFLSLGYQWKDILTISADELARYESGGDVKYPEGTVLQKIGDVNVYQIKNGAPQLIPDIATFKKLKLSWSKVLKIPAGDFDRLYGAASSSGATSTPTPSSGPSSAPTPAPTSPPTSSPTPPFSSAPTSAPAAAQPNIRVGIWQVPLEQQQIIFSGSGPYDVYDKNGQLIASKPNGEQFSVEVTNPANVFAKLVPKAGTILKIDSYSDLSWNKLANYNQFRGNLELLYSTKSSQLWVVNELPLEDYLKGVAETNQGLAMEYLKTMIVAARTYAYNYQKQGGKYGANEVYQITNTTKDQLYKGYGREQFASDILAAAAATYGEIVTYNGQPAVTAYSSGAPELITSGSRSACSVWGGKYCQPGFEYLGGEVKDPAGTAYSYQSCGSGNHCVGLSGAGARQLAALGKTYKEILVYYYPGTVVQKIY